MKKLPFNWLNWQQILLDDPRPSFPAKGMGLFLHTYMNNNNDLAFPSIATIQGRLNIGSNTTVIKHINELVKLGYLVKQKRFGQSVIYHANTPDLDSITESTLMHELNHSITESKPSVLQNLNTNNQDNNQFNNQDRETKRFSRPKLKEITEYMATKNGNREDALAFEDYYESVGWKVGRHKMVNWKNAASGWLRRKEQYEASKRTGAERTAKRTQDYNEAFEQIVREEMGTGNF